MYYINNYFRNENIKGNTFFLFSEQILQLCYIIKNSIWIQMLRGYIILLAIKLFMGCRNNIEMKALALDTINPSSIPSNVYGLPSKSVNKAVNVHFKSMFSTQCGIPKVLLYWEVCRLNLERRIALYWKRKVITSVQAFQDHQLSSHRKKFHKVK